jgi:hypothetical protein
VVQIGDDGVGSGAVIPINVAKEFLEANGLALVLPPRLGLSLQEHYPFKGLHLSVAGAVRDQWPGRSRWKSVPDSNGLSLRIDRVLSPLDLGDLEARLLSGVDFGGFGAQRRGENASGPREIPLSRARVKGSASGWVGEGLYGVEYALFKAGAERIVARYSGPIDLVAYNRGVLRRSLDGIEITRLLRKPITEPLPIELEGVRLPVSDAPVVSMPKGWTRETVAAFLPAGLPPPDAALSASPKDDFTIAARVLWWRRAPSAAEDAAAAASSMRGAFGEASYTVDEKQLGVAWVAAGRFLPVGSSLLLFEIRTPREKAFLLDALHERWLAAGLS